MWDDIPTYTETTAYEESDSDFDAGNCEEHDHVIELETSNTAPKKRLRRIRRFIGSVRVHCCN